MAKFTPADNLPYWVKAIGEYGNSSLYALDAVIPHQLAAYFPSQRPDIYKTFPDLIDAKQFTAAEQDATMAGLAGLSKIINVEFYKTSDPVVGTQEALVFFKAPIADAAGYGLVLRPAAVGTDFTYPARAGGIFISDKQANPLGGSLMAHETAHALGLGHPEEMTYHLQPQDMQAHLTIMSNTAYGVPLADFQLGPLDIAAAQYVYGPSLSVRTGDDTYQLNQATHNFVWDGVGTNTMSASTATQGATLYLTPGEWGHIGAKASHITAPGQVTVNFGSNIQNLTGTQFDDHLYGTTGANVIEGGAGNDVIYGLGGADTINGGAGTDTAVFANERVAYLVSKAGAANIVAGRAGSPGAGDGYSYLTQVERLKFADTSVALDMSGGGTGEVVARVIGAMYGAAPIANADWAGIGMWAIDSGAYTTHSLIDALIGGLYGPAPSNAAVVNNLFTNLVGQLPGPEAQEVFIGGLNRGEFTQAELVEYASNLDATADLIGLQTLQNSGWAFNEFFG